MNHEPINKKVLDRFNRYNEIKKIRDSGEFLCIPFKNSYPKLSNYLPGIMKGVMYKITAGSGVGKTQLTKSMFVIAPLDFMRKNPKLNLKIKILYFALEESEDEFIDSLVVNLLANKFNIRIDVLILRGLRNEYIDDKLLNKIRECEEDVSFYMNHIEVIDSEYNPTGMYKYCRRFSEKNGTHVWEDQEFVKKTKDGEIIRSIEKVYKEYIPHDPNLHVIAIGDHISLITPEKDKYSGKMLSKHEAMAKWSTEYCRKQLTKHWDWTVVNVQQQEQGSEKQQYTNSGKSIVTKTEPSLDALANNKEIQRDDYVIISVYSPDKFGFDEYHGYDISRMRDTFRAVKIIKNRLGTPNKYVHLLFDGATNRFVELPVPSLKDELDSFYATSDSLLGR